MPVKIKIISDFPFPDEKILAGERFSFKIGRFHGFFEMFTYKSYLDFWEQLKKTGLEILGGLSEDVFTENNISENLKPVINSDNHAIRSIIDLIIYFANIKPVGVYRLMPRPAFKYYIRRYIEINCYFTDIFNLFEQVLRFNFAIKKKLLQVLTADHQHPAENNFSEILQGMPKEHADLVKAGIPIPRF